MAYIWGDFNTNILISKCAKIHHFLDTLCSLDLHPLISKPSRLTNGTSSLIDNIFTNYKNIPLLINGLSITDISDNYPVFCIFDSLFTVTNKSKINNKTIKFMTNNNLIHYNNDIVAFDWSNQ